MYACLDCGECGRENKRLLRPFKLGYLALSVILNNNLTVSDNDNIIQKNEEIFKNEEYRKNWINWRYCIYDNYIQLFNDAIHIISYLSEKKRN